MESVSDGSLCSAKNKRRKGHTLLSTEGYVNRFHIFHLSVYISISLDIFSCVLIFEIKCLDINCAWMAWSEWTQCPTNCEKGTRHRNRSKGIVEIGEGICTGQRNESETCNPLHCSKLIFDYVLR